MISSTRKQFLLFHYILFVLLFLAFSIVVPAQESDVFTLTADEFQDGKSVGLSKNWKFKIGDDAAWADTNFDDAAWEKLETPFIKSENLMSPEWNGRGWFRLHFNVEKEIAGDDFALITYQTGATEIYLDGKKLEDFGKIEDSAISEYNPKGLPIPFRFETDGEHVLAVRFASELFADPSTLKARWMTSSEVYPGMVLSIKKFDDIGTVIEAYANYSSMRIGIFFVGFLLALALLHFLLYLFYRVERGNLFYSIYAATFAVFLLIGNYITFGHQNVFSTFVLNQIRGACFAFVFVSLLAFLHVAFKKRPGKLFWILTGLWGASIFINLFLVRYLSRLGIITPILIGLTFAFFVYILVASLREKRSGAWILMVGVQIFSLGMLSILVREIFKLDLPGIVSATGEICVILAIPVAVSMFLARNFATTNRDLKTQLEQVEFLSHKQIEQEKHTAKLQAENERRAQELEEAKQLQISMLPKKLPQIDGLEIAAYMKPATEVGGDYYDFHVDKDGTLTVAVGDATGHGLKAGTVVTATKGLFNNLAPAPDIPDTLQQISRSLKAMNLRGLFMALTLIKLKDKNLITCAAGMPSTLVYRAASQTVEEINIRAVPLGSLTSFKYQKQEIILETGDCVVVLSDGFPEMFNDENEMLGFGKAAEILLKNAELPAQEIIDELVKTGEDWAGSRPQDDDVTFVVLKYNSNFSK